MTKAGRSPKQKAQPVPSCPYCDRNAVYQADSSHHHQGRDNGPVWECLPCDARVSCKPNGSPRGPLANAALRRARAQAHAAFDPLWKARAKLAGIPEGRAMGRGFRWLAQQLGIEPAACRISKFDVRTCLRAIDACSPYLFGAAEALRIATAPPPTAGHHR